MWSEFFEKNVSDEPEKCNQCPEINGHPQVLFPESQAVHKRVAVTFCYIENRIQLKEYMKALWKRVDIPEKRCYPKSELNHHADYVVGVADKCVER